MFFYTLLRAWCESCIPASVHENPELLRRHKLAISFCLLGIAFGLVYATFYFLIGYYGGSLIITICVMLLGCTPRLLRYPQAPLLAGNYFALILTIVLTGLSVIEGGIHGHTIAWLCTIPLIALLLAGRRPALAWCAVSVSVTVLFALLDHAGVTFPPRYPHEIKTVVGIAGYSGLIVFITILAGLLERNRKAAYEQLEITARRLTEANDKLIRLNAEKNEFLGIAAHDLKNPLTSVLGMSELIQLANKNGNPEIDRYAGQIFHAATRMRDIISDLLDGYAFEEKNIRLKHEAINLKELLAGLLPTHQSKSVAKGIDIRMEIAAEPVVARGDRRAFYQIADNLISNAVKFTPQGRGIRIRLNAGASSVRFEVEDEGPGIPETDRVNLYHRFSQLSAKPTAGESSHGLGLSIAKKFTEAMGGTILCKPFSGTGACFIVELPKAN